MPKRLVITVVCFHIVAVLAVLAGIAIIVAGLTIGGAFYNGMLGTGPEADPMMRQVITVVARYMQIAIPVFGAALIMIAVFVEAIIYSLRRKRYWAWITGIVLCGLLILSGFKTIIPIILGGLALWGLVDPDSVDAFRPVKPIIEN